DSRYPAGDGRDGLAVALGNSSLLATSSVPSCILKLICLPARRAWDGRQRKPEIKIARKAVRMRIVHISDMHFWHITLNPLRLMSKRILGMANLILNRARFYKMEVMSAVVERVKELKPDHMLVTGDLTTTALDEEFQAARRALTALAQNPSSLT